MTEPRDNTSLDELFRSSFEALPDTPAPNGWDQPSPQVWEQVQKAIQPRSGWTGLQIAGASILILLLTTMLYLQTRPDTTPAVRESPAPAIEQPAAPPVAAPAINEPASETELPAQVITTAPLRNELEEEQEQPAPARAEPDGPEFAVPLPGTGTDIPPNTTERRKQEIWKTPLQTLPARPPRKIQSSGQN
jgi:hypothetical protein